MNKVSNERYELIHIFSLLSSILTQEIEKTDIKELHWMDNTTIIA